MHGHISVVSRCTVTWTYCHDARSYERIVTMHGHMSVLSRCTVMWAYCHDARSYERIVTMHGYMNVLSRCTVIWAYCHDARSHERIVTMHGHMNVLSRCTITWTYCHDARSHERKIKNNILTSLELQWRHYLLYRTTSCVSMCCPRAHAHARTLRYYEAYHCATEPHPDLSGHFHFLQQLAGWANGNLTVVMAAVCTIPLAYFPLSSFDTAHT
jgi:hypothetical protein